MSNILIFAVLFAVLSATSTAQIVECEIIPIKSSFDCYENVIVKVQLRNKSHDTVCVDNIAHGFPGRPMKIYIDGKEYPYQGVDGLVMSGVYVNPFSEYCFYMEVLYSLSDHLTLTRIEPGKHELLYHSDIYIVKNRRRTRTIVARISGAVRYEVFCSQQSEAIARTLRDKSIINGRLIDDQELYRRVHDMIEEHGIDAVDRVAGYLIHTAVRREGTWSNKVHAKTSTLRKKVTTGIPGECVCRWDE